MIAELNSAIFICIILLLLLIIQELNLIYSGKGTGVSYFGHWLRQMTRIKVFNVFFVRNRQTDIDRCMMRRPLLLLLIRQKAGKPRCVNISVPMEFSSVNAFQASTKVIPYLSAANQEVIGFKILTAGDKALFHWKKSPWMKGAQDKSKQGVRIYIGQG